jgi:hypothetical protein
MTIRQIMVAGVIPGIRWVSSIEGYAKCPGKDLHTTDTTQEVRIRLDGVTTVFCFHQRCRWMIEEINRDIRARIRKAEREGGQTTLPTAADLERGMSSQNLRRAEAEARFLLPTILRKTVSIPQLLELSPVKLKGREERCR